MVRRSSVTLLALTMLLTSCGGESTTNDGSVPPTNGAQDTSLAPAQPTTASLDDTASEITMEPLGRIRLPAAVIPSPAGTDAWFWRLRPGEELTFAPEESPAGVAVDVALAGEYTVRSEGLLQVQRAAGLEEISPGTDVTIRPGDAVIYLDNQAAQVMRHSGTDAARVFSVGIFSTTPPSEVATGPLRPEDWERSGLVGHDLTMSIERLTVPAGGSVPAFVPDVRAPRIFGVVEGAAQAEIISASAATPPPSVPFDRGEIIGFSTLGEGEQLHLRNTGDRPLVLLQVTLSADQGATAPAATPPA